MVSTNYVSKFDNYEIIIVNDGSNDGSINLLERLVKENKNKGMRITFGQQGKKIYAPIAPGLISTLKVKKWCSMVASPQME